MKFVRKNQLNLNNNSGFTLVELLVVIVIVGVLSAVALPSFLAQVGKAREIEAKNNLGAISRAQQSYYFEKQTFAQNINNLNISNLSNNRYYTFPNPSMASDAVKHQAIAINPNTDGIKNYAVGVYYDSGLYRAVFCQGQRINQLVNAPDSNTGSCTNGGIKIN